MSLPGSCLSLVTSSAVSLDQFRVPLEGFLQGGRDDVLGVRVHHVVVSAVLLARVRPLRRKLLVGRPSQQESVAGGELIDLVLLLFFARQLERPERLFYDA